MNKSNTLLTSDNKGRAEPALRGAGQGPGQSGLRRFLRPASNHADTTPNLNLDGTGPTQDQLRNTEIIGDRQFDKALALYQGAAVQLTGAVDFRHQYNDYSNPRAPGVRRRPARDPATRRWATPSPPAPRMVVAWRTSA